MTETPGPYCILVVDDDESVRKVTMRALEIFGFTTLGAGDGLDAVKTLRKSKNAVHCAVVDMSMPGLDGEETMRRLHAVANSLPVLLASGLSADDMPQHHPDPAFAGYLQKPYEIGILAETVRTAIEATRLQHPFTTECAAAD